MRSMSAVLLAGAALAVAGFLACSNSNNSSTTPTTTPVITAPPVTLPDSPGVCSPTPSPLYRIDITVQQSDGSNRTLKASPMVANTDDYCRRLFGGVGDFCPTRSAGDPQKAACDAIAVGKAVDTGRWGPYWKYVVSNLEYPCTDTDPGCKNDPDNQWLLLTKGQLKFLACANPSVPMAPGQGRCGICALNNGPSNPDNNCS